MPAVGAITDVIYSARRCEHIHMRATWKNWFEQRINFHLMVPFVCIPARLEQVLQEMWDEISFSAWIHHMQNRSAWYSIIILHQPSNFSHASLPEIRILSSARLLLVPLLTTNTTQFKSLFVQCHLRIQYLLYLVYRAAKWHGHFGRRDEWVE